MKYKPLENSELQRLEKEFVEFLVINGIEASEWMRIKKRDPAGAEAIIDQFSDVVWESVLRKVKFLEKITPRGIYCFRCLSKEIELINLVTGNAAEHHEILTKGDTLDDKSIKLLHTRKKYGDVREAEIFRMIEMGCTIANGVLFKRISKLLPEK